MKDTFERDMALRCRKDPDKKSLAGVLGWYNGRRVVSIKCDSKACRHVYDSEGRSSDAVFFHIWDVETGECIDSEHRPPRKPTTLLTNGAKETRHG